MEDALEREWSYFREVLEDGEKAFLIDEASETPEQIKKHLKSDVNPEIFRKLLFERDADSSDEEWKNQREIRKFLDEYARLTYTNGDEDLSQRLLSRKLPGFDPELRPVTHGSMKDTYRDFDRNYIVHIPSSLDFIDRPQASVEQALTWMHNYRTLQENDIPTATDYDMVISEHRGFIAPAVIGEFRNNLVEYRNVTDETEELLNESHESEDVLEKLFRRQGIKVANLLIEGEVAYNEQIKNMVTPPFNGLAYDKDRKKVVAYDMGELGETTFQLLPESETNSYEEFIERHGIDERANNLLRNYDTESLNHG